MLSTLEKTTQEFGELVGIRHMQPKEGVIHLAIEAIGDLYMEQGKSDILIYLARTFLHPSETLFRKALSLCSFEHPYPYSVHVGLFKEKIIFLLHIPEESFSLPVLDRCIGFLNQLHNTLKES